MAADCNIMPCLRVLRPFMEMTTAWRGVARPGLGALRAPDPSTAHQRGPRAAPAGEAQDMNVKGIRPLEYTSSWKGKACFGSTFPILYVRVRMRYSIA